MQIRIGEIIEGKVTGITKYGAFISVNKETAGMIHISEISSEFIKDINGYLKLNQMIKAVVIGVNEDGKLALSIKQLQENKNIEPEEEAEEKPEFAGNAQNPASSRNFEDMLNKFKRESDEKMSDLKYLEQKRTGPSRKKTNQKYE